MDQLKCSWTTFFQTMMSEIDTKIQRLTEGNEEIIEEMYELKQVLQSLHGSLEICKDCGWTSASVWKKKSKCVCALQNVKLCFDEKIILKAVDATASVDGGHDRTVKLWRIKIRPFLISVWKSGIGLKASIPKRKLMYSIL